MDWTLPIETDRLTLRLHEARDREAFVSLVTDPRFYEHLSVPERQRTGAGATEVFELVLSSYGTDEPVWGLTIGDKATEDFIGTVALHPVPFGDALEIFYAVIPDRQNQGIAVEAVRALLSALPGRDLVALAPPDNLASQRVAAAAGMVDEGVERPLGGPERHRFVRPALG